MNLKNQLLLTQKYGGTVHLVVISRRMKKVKQLVDVPVSLPCVGNPPYYLV
jgi:hypothetical protein